MSEPWEFEFGERFGLWELLEGAAKPPKLPEIINTHAKTITKSAAVEALIFSPTIVCSVLVIKTYS